MLLYQVSWNVAKRMCVSYGIEAANIPRNGINGITARLAEVNSQYKDNQLREIAKSGNQLNNFFILLFSGNKTFVTVDFNISPF